MVEWKKKLKSLIIFHNANKINNYNRGGKMKEKLKKRKERKKKVQKKLQNKSKHKKNKYFS